MIMKDESVLLPLAGHIMPFLSVSCLNGSGQCGEVTDGVVFEFRSPLAGVRREGCWLISRAALLALLRKIEATEPYAATAGDSEEE